MTSVHWQFPVLLTFCLLTACGSQRDARSDPHDVAGRFNEFWPYSVKMPPGVAEFRDVGIGMAGDRSLEANIVRRKARAKSPRPALVFVHGGGWAGGDRHQFTRQAAYLAERHNIFGLLLEYRLSDEAKYPAALHDVKAAIRFVRSIADKYNIDPMRIGLVGGSAGAHLSALASVTQGDMRFEGDGGHAAYSSSASLAVLFNGEFDLPPLVANPQLTGMMRRFLGATLDENPDLYRETSPQQHLTIHAPPMLFLHGTNDTGVPYTQSTNMHEKLLSLGVHSELELYEGQPHAWFNKDPHWKITIQRVEKFLAAQWGLDQR